MSKNDILKAISDSKKYKDLNRRTIENIFSLYSHNEQKVREKLHQIWGAYYSARPDFNKLRKKIENGKLSLEKVLLIHSSTKERHNEYKDLYNYIFSNVDGLKVADLGSGFNPIFLILLNKKELKYMAYDIDNKQQEFLNFVFKKFGFNRYKANVADILLEIIEPVDIAFAFKLLPVLDQISKEQTDNMLKNLLCKYLVVSFPNKSLGGREKGMKGTYKELYIDRLKSIGLNLINKKEFLNESVYIFQKN